MRLRINLLVLAACSLVLVSVLVPLALLLRSQAADRAVDSAKVTMHGPEQASVSFRQTYRSEKLNTKSRKTLELVKADGRWLIREEKAGK